MVIRVQIACFRVYGLHGHRCLLALLLALFLQPVIADAQPESEPIPQDEAILAAMDRMKNWLYDEQLSDGSWEHNYVSTYNRQAGGGLQQGGETALVTFALLKAGESYQSGDQYPQGGLKAAINYLQNVELQGTYAVGMRNHVWAALPQRYNEQLQSDTQWLLNAHVDGIFDYSQHPRPRIKCLSRTILGTLGLWEAAKRGQAIPQQFWQDQLEYAITTQQPDGGYGYGPYTGRYANDSSCNMTTAGLSMLLICLEQLEQINDKDKAAADEAIRKANAWLGEYFMGRPTHSRDRSFPGYFWYAIERIALASGKRTINQQDWYAEGARWILEQEAGKGKVGNHADTAFALIFLASGRSPIWMNVLELDGVSDIRLAQWTRTLSDSLERNYAWQSVRSDESVAVWRTAPMLLVTPRAGAIHPELVEQLVTYIDRGGLLVIDPSQDGRATTQLTRLLERAFRGSRFVNAASDHPVYKLLRPIKRSRNSAVRVMHNGVRDLAIVLPAKDRWTGMSQQDETDDDALGLMLNLFALATNRGRLMPRLAEVSSTQKASLFVDGDAVVVKRLLRKRTPNPEPRAWVHDDWEVTLTYEEASVEDLQQQTFGLLHIAHTDAWDLTEEELFLIRNYTQAGGTVFIETLGGHDTIHHPTNFASHLGEQLSRFLESPIIALDPNDPMLIDAVSSEPLPVRYRPQTRSVVPNKNTHSFKAIEVDGRPAILLSSYDLSLGLQGCQHVTLQGYDSETSRAIIQNWLMRLD